MNQTAKCIALIISILYHVAFIFVWSGELALQLNAPFLWLFLLLGVFVLIETYKVVPDSMNQNKKQFVIAILVSIVLLFIVSGIAETITGKAFSYPKGRWIDRIYFLFIPEALLGIYNSIKSIIHIKRNDS
ncbi:hypothetical protein CAFE_15160 [Caprobacter fermentans]|uniref:Uncharacterized protein n=1 Tax=Caproicibacter fermentans TaxID=2576756 RepID=A0A6N8HYR6_9FIRM|nr:hypothetical protein [Caproicibacter fermentans]MVB10818.1 hypothetical protein [Caproicibacter fermentans]